MSSDSPQRAQKSVLNPSTTISSTPASSTTFTLFPLLPTELRLKIWQLVLSTHPPRILELEVIYKTCFRPAIRRPLTSFSSHLNPSTPPRDTFASCNHLPAPAYTCHESLSIAHTLYSRFFETTAHTPFAVLSSGLPVYDARTSVGGYFRPCVDILSLKGMEYQGPINEFICVEGLCHEQIAVVRFLKLNCWVEEGSLEGLKMFKGLELLMFAEMDVVEVMVGVMQGVQGELGRLEGMLGQQGGWRRPDVRFVEGAGVVDSDWMGLWDMFL